MTVPIIGQPKIGDWLFSIVITCPCGETFIWRGRPGFIVPCKCDKLYTITGMPTLDGLGQLRLPIAVGKKS